MYVLCLNIIVYDLKLIYQLYEKISIVINSLFLYVYHKKIDIIYMYIQCMYYNYTYIIMS